ncbi:unnamed protein product, partial [Hapterophycus canaliculatus]
LPLTPFLLPVSPRPPLSPLSLPRYLATSPKVRLAPAGTNKVQAMLQEGGMGCAQGGITGTFTPMYLSVCRKPL